jgi:hypothetical protein
MACFAGLCRHPRQTLLRQQAHTRVIRSSPGFGPELEGITVKQSLLLILALFVLTVCIGCGGGLPWSVVPAAAAAPPQGVANAHMQLNCDTGQQLAHALSVAKPGSTIQLTGTCRERVTIATDGITLDGQGTAVIEGEGAGPFPSDFDPVVTIDGARRVTLRGLTVQNSPGEGILAKNGASFRLEHVTAQNNGNAGIALFANSTGELEAVMSQGNLTGLAGFDSAVAILHGSIVLTGNLVHGLTFEGKSTVDLRGAQLNASNNGGFGLVMAGSELNIFDFGQGSNITTSGNGGCGIAIVSGAHLLVLSPPPLFGSGINVITVQDNGVCGFFMPVNGSVESPLGAARFIVENNPVGLALGNNSAGFILGGLQVQGNGIGVLADGTGHITFGAFVGNPSFITGNIVTDVDLQFGSRATFCDITIDNVNNDSTALVRTLPSCPAPP